MYNSMYTVRSMTVDKSVRFAYMTHEAKHFSNLSSDESAPPPLPLPKNKKTNCTYLLTGIVSCICLARL